MENNNKIFFTPGDVVRLKQHSLIKSPFMLVIRKENNLLATDEASRLKGIRCRWFTDSNLMQEAVFNFKDLEKICQ